MGSRPLASSAYGRHAIVRRRTKRITDEPGIGLDSSPAERTAWHEPAPSGLRDLGFAVP